MTTGLKQPLGTVASDRPALALALGFQRAAALAQPRPATLWARHELPRIELDLDAILVVVGRLGGLLALAVQALLGLSQRLAAALAGAQLLGQLVAAIRPVELILAPVDLGCLAQDCSRDLAEVTVGVHRRVGRHLRAVDRDHPDRRQPDPRTQPEHAREHLAERVLVAQRNSAIVE